MSHVMTQFVLRLAVPAIWPQFGLSFPRWQAHRGAHLWGAQENTMSAFREAKARGALMFECDVRLSKDGIPVCHHDETLVRLSGIDEQVSQLTAQQLKEKANAPTLQEVLSTTEVPRLINIELKTSEVANESLERRVIDVIRKNKAESRVLLSSFNPVSLWKVSNLAPEIPRALLASQEDHPANKRWLKELWSLPFLSVHLLHLEDKMLKGPLLRAVRTSRFPFAVWTVNDRARAEELFALGAKSIITDQDFYSKN
jgi:glycerophosphoryl diester phosphodiesterase